MKISKERVYLSKVIWGIDKDGGRKVPSCETGTLCYVGFQGTQGGGADSQNWVSDTLGKCRTDRVGLSVHLVFLDVTCFNWQEST